MRRGWFVVSSIVAILAGGCTLVPRPLKPVRYYSILPPAMAPEAPAGQQERVIAVRLLDAPPRYRERIFFRREGHAAGFHEFDRWADPPAEMATAMLRRTLQAAGLTATVADERLVRRPSLILEGRLTRFDEVQGKDTWSAECEIEIALKKADDGGVVLYTLLAASREARAKTTPAFVEAMNSAAAEAAQKAVEAIKRALEDEKKAKTN